MKFVTFQGASALPQAGVLLGDRVVGLAAAGFSDMLAVLASGEQGRARIENFVYNRRPPIPLFRSLPSNFSRRFHVRQS